MATLTITTTAAEDARIVTAFGAYLGLGQNATGPQVKAAVINFVKGVVRDQELALAMEAARVSATDVDPS